MTVKFDCPKQVEYDLYIAAMTRDKVFSEYDHVKIHYPGIRQLEIPDVEVDGSFIIVTFPPAYEINDIYGTLHGAEEFVERDIIGYVVRLTAGGVIRGEKFNIDKSGITRNIWAPTGTWDLTIGAYDCTANSTTNTALFEATFSEPVIVEIT